MVFHICPWIILLSKHLCCLCIFLSRSQCIVHELSLKQSAVSAKADFKCWCYHIWSVFYYSYFNISANWNGHTLVSIDSSHSYQHSTRGCNLEYRVLVFVVTSGSNSALSMLVIFSHVFLRVEGVFYESLEFFCILIYCASQSSRKYKRASTGTLFVPSLFKLMTSWRFKSWIVGDQKGRGERHWGRNMLLGSAFENYINWCQYKDPIPRFHHCYTSFRVVSACVFFFVFGLITVSCTNTSSLVICAI